jgi:DNA-directed RNA polymerase specialized sigma24 family protein
LPPADRDLISKRYDRRMSVVTLAEDMQCNVATLRVRLFRIRQGLKACVEAVVSRGGAI